MIAYHGGPFSDATIAAVPSPESNRLGFHNRAATSSSYNSCQIVWRYRSVGITTGGDAWMLRLRRCFISRRRPPNANPQPDAFGRTGGVSRSETLSLSGRWRNRNVVYVECAVGS